ncbi:MAG: hypothetical protein JEY71_12380 [Sphaerochaeta sp.]|nr:hypothetical protein [Sphaerochaeta sp.]
MKVNYKVSKVFSYIVAQDSGFSPNPFWGQCSLACCKPTIRRSIGKRWSSSHDTWIVGISPKSRGNELIYIMRVDHCVEFPEYYESYPQKRPDFSKGQVDTCGDNIYRPIDRRYEQLRSRHSYPPFGDSWSVNNNAMNRDIGGKYVLLSDNFVYYGKETVKIEGSMKELIVGRGYRCNFSQDAIKALEKYINERSVDFQNGAILADPDLWRLG